MSPFNKADVKRAFGASALTYEAYATVQRKAASRLIEFVPKAEGFSTIVEAGCGTGFLTTLIAEHFPEAELFCFDIALPMLCSVRKSVGQRRCRVFAADCESLPIGSERVELLASSLTYQWMPAPLAAFREAARVVRKGGWFVFSTLGENTFFELKCSVERAMAIRGRNGLPPLMEFCGKAELEGLLLKAGFREVTLKGEPLKAYYPSLWQFLRTLRYIGATNPHRAGSKSLARGILLREVERIYHTEYSSFRGLEATYDIVYVVARK